MKLKLFRNMKKFLIDIFFEKISGVPKDVWAESNIIYKPKYKFRWQVAINITLIIFIIIILIKI